VLLAEVERDPLLLRSDTIIVDEAHERSLNIDFLLGYLKRLLPKRPDLKVIVSSATIDVDRFSAHFGGAPVVSVGGRVHPIETRWLPPEGDAADLTQAERVARGVEECIASGDGDILAFLGGERDIHDAADLLARTPAARGCEILPLYARLPAGEQDRVFRPSKARRIILATNVAETSVTVPESGSSSTRASRASRGGPAGPACSGCRSSRSRRPPRTSAAAAAAGSDRASACASTRRRTSSPASRSPHPSSCAPTSRTSSCR
jgi:hypothetical protein